MLVHYRLPGLVACIALIYYALVVFAIFRLIPVTLTLAGVAAFVLSVGMAVDANILIFERMKEELRAGKTLVSAVEAGFNRAWNSIFDSNISSIITAGILSNRRRVPPFGLAGGGAGACGETRVERRDGRIEILAATARAELAAGDAIVISTPGGGGFGTPDTPR